MSNTPILGSYGDVGGSGLSGFQTITASATLTIDSPKQGYVSSPGAAITITLPTTDVKAGFRYRVQVIGATETNFVRLNSSGANEIDRIGGQGFIEVMALQDAPTTAANWRVLDVYEETGSITLTATGANTNNASAVFLRRNKIVTANITQANLTTLGGIIITLSGVLTRFRPPAVRPIAAHITNNTNISSGLYNVQAGGTIDSYTYNVTAFNLQCAVSTILTYNL